MKIDERDNPLFVIVHPTKRKPVFPLMAENLIFEAVSTILMIQFGFHHRPEFRKKMLFKSDRENGGNLDS